MISLKSQILNQRRLINQSFRIKQPYNIYGWRTQFQKRIYCIDSSEYKWVSYISRRNNLELAVADVTEGALKQLDDRDAQLAIVFVSSYFSAEYDKLTEWISERLPSVKLLVGCSGFGIVGMSPDGPQELEREPALSLTLAKFPDTVAFGASFMNDLNLPDLDSGPDAWRKAMQMEEEEQPTSFVILSDVTFRNLQNLLSGIDFAFPGAPKVGGLVSQAQASQSRMLFLWEKGNEHHIDAKGCFFDGAICLYFTGDITMHLIIAQGCRALSENVWTVVNKSQEAVITEVVDESGRVMSPIKALQIELGYYKEQELKQISSNLMVSVALDPLKETLDLNDFVVRQIIGVIPSSQAIVVGDKDIKLGTRLKFVARDLMGAQQDMENHCLDFKRREFQATMEGKESLPPVGTLMFNCNGRGQGLYGTPNYDSKKVSSFIPVPISGFQCNGEIGQLGDTTWLHGFTCALGVFRAGKKQEDQESKPQEEATPEQKESKLEE